MATSVNTELKKVSRREFLTYVWGASAALLAAGAGGAAIWFSLPRVKQSPVFQFDPTDIPLVGNPIPFPEGRIWLSRTADGLLALSMYCPYRGEYFKWVATNHRFECPVCGSKFGLNGHLLQDDFKGPARRDLDR